MDHDESQHNAIIPKSVAIGMTVAVSLPLLVAIPGLLAFVTDNLAGGTRNGLAFWMTFLQNGAALFACVMVLRGTKRYVLPSLASVLTFVAWFWLPFSSLPMVLVLLGMAVSVPVGIWSFATIRKPDIRSAFGSQFDPVESIAQFVLPKLPKMKAEPTPANVSRFSMLTLSGFCVASLLLGWRLGSPGDSWRKELGERERAQYAAAMEVLKRADQKWTSGKKDEAVDDYFQLVSMETGSTFRSDQSSALSRAYCRAIDYQADRGGTEAARDLVRKALRVRVPPITFTLAIPLATRVLTEERRLFEGEQQKQHQEYLAEETAKQDYVRRRVEQSSGDTSAVENLDWPTGKESGWLEKEGSGGTRRKGGTTRSSPADLKRMGITEDNVDQSLSDMRSKGLTAKDRQMLEDAKAGGMSEDDALRHMAEGRAMREKSLTPAVRAWMDTPEGRKAMDQNIDNLNRIMQRKQ